MHESHIGCTCFRKRKFTMDNPPRVYDVARAIGRTSNETSYFLRYICDYAAITPSHKVPLPIAMKLIYAATSVRAS